MTPSTAPPDSAAAPPKLIAQLDALLARRQAEARSRYAGLVRRAAAPRDGGPGQPSDAEELLALMPVLGLDAAAIARDVAAAAPRKRPAYLFVSPSLTWPTPGGGAGGVATLYASSWAEPTGSPLPALDQYRIIPAPGQPAEEFDQLRAIVGADGAPPAGSRHSGLTRESIQLLRSIGIDPDGDPDRAAQVTRSNPPIRIRYAIAGAIHRRAKGDLPERRVMPAILAALGVDADAPPPPPTRQEAAGRPAYKPDGLVPGSRWARGREAAPGYEGGALEAEPRPA